MHCWPNSALGSNSNQTGNSQGATWNSLQGEEGWRECTFTLLFFSIIYHMAVHAASPKFCENLSRPSYQALNICFMKLLDLPEPLTSQRSLLSGCVRSSAHLHHFSSLQNILLACVSLMCAPHPLFFPIFPSLCHSRSALFLVVAECWEAEHFQVFSSLTNSRPGGNSYHSN